MLFTFSTTITTLPFLVAVALQHVKKGGTVIPLSKCSSLVNAVKSDKTYMRAGVS
ncbi:hypothetical protein BS17DRAFT_790944 [Gyrodon lividus]|nr:hypothetical protein BS17DRAFT_790944 [Gyrodon lividus]